MFSVRASSAASSSALDASDAVGAVDAEFGGNAPTMVTIQDPAPLIEGHRHQHAEALDAGPKGSFGGRLQRTEQRQALHSDPSLA